MQIQTTVDVSSQQIADLIVTAFEGGIAYWCESAHLTHKPTYTPDPHEVGVVAYSHRQVYEGDFRFEVRTHDGEEFIVGPDELGAGLALFASKYPKQFADFVEENYDAETADMFWQIVCMKDVIYG
jgi:hypothetical protein